MTLRIWTILGIERGGEMTKEEIINELEEMLKESREAYAAAVTDYDSGYAIGKSASLIVAINLLHQLNKEV